MPRDPDETRTALAPAPDRAGEAPLGISVLHSPDQAAVGRWFAIEGALTLGRRAGPGLDLVIADPLLSRRHLILRRQAALALYGLEDPGSKNGCAVDGSPVRRAGLERGALIRVGDTLLLVESRPGRPLIGAMVGRSSALLATCATLDRVAPTDLGVVLRGETGSGKELCARRVHEASGRTGRFMAVNCAAIPESLAEAALFGHTRGAYTGAERGDPGLLQRADGGTLFLDEIGDLSPGTQARLLRAVDTGAFHPVGSAAPVRVNLRVVSATWKDLDALVAAGDFRADLLARISGVTVTVPPLRERRADIPLLARRALELACPERRIDWSADYLEALLLHRWPGNVRQLTRQLQRDAALLDGERLERAAGSRPAPTDGPPDRAQLEALLLRHRGKVSGVAAALGKDRKQIYRWLARDGLDPERYR